MGDLSIEQIKQKANQARNSFTDYINTLLGSGARKATQEEILLFNLNGFYLDDSLNSQEIGQIKSPINSLELNNLIDQGLITYDNERSKFSLRGNISDINRDSNIDSIDAGAINYILNFNGGSLDTLDDILAIAGDKDKIADYYIKSWARDRGLEEGTESFTAFYNKFYNTLYKHPTAPMEVTDLKKILQLYDSGLGKTNINDLDDYIPAARANIPFSLVMSLYRFELSNNFDATDKAQKRREYVNILINGEPEVKKFLAQALNSRKVPITSETLKVSTLDPILAIAGDEKKMVDHRIKLWAQERKLTGADYDSFVDKFYNDYFKDGHESGNNMQDLTTLLRIYDGFRIKDKENFNIEKLNIYASALKEQISSSNLSLLQRFETSSVFALTGAARESKLEEYLGILKNGSSEVKSQFIQALKTGKIPITGEVLTLDKLDQFLSKIQQTDGIIDLTLETWAKQRDLVNNPALTNDEYDLFVNKFKSFYDNDNTFGDLKALVSIYDDGVLSLNQLDQYASGLKRKIKQQDIFNLYKFEKSEVFQNHVASSQRDSKIASYMDILVSGSKEQKQILEGALRNGKTIPLTGEELSITALDETLRKVAEEYGLAELGFENFANKRELTGTEKQIFIDKLRQWHKTQNPPNTNYEISISDIKNLLRLYDDEKLSLDQLDIYAKGLSEKIPFSQLQVIYKFETGDKFNLSGSSRESKLQAYFNVIKGANAQKTKTMLQAMKSGKIPISGDELTLSKLDELLIKFDDENALAEMYIDKWTADRNETSNFKAKFMHLYKNPDFELSISELSSILKLYDSVDNFELDKLDLYAKALANGAKYTDIARIFKLENSDIFNTVTNRNTQIKKYLDIYTTGNLRQKQVLTQSLKSNKIPFINTELNIVDLNTMLDLVENEEDLNRFIIGKLAEDRGMIPNSTSYNNFIAKFHTEYHIDLGLTVGEIKNLLGLYDTGDFDFDKLGKMARAIKDGISYSILVKFHRFTQANNLSDADVNRYLSILMGEQGDAKQKILLEAIRSQYIPISNTPLF